MVPFLTSFQGFLKMGKCAKLVDIMDDIFLFVTCVPDDKRSKIFYW